MILALYTASFFTTSLNLVNSTGADTNLSTFNSSPLLFKLFNLVDTFPNLSISNLPTSDFKLAKPTFSANFYVSTNAAFFKSVFVAKLDKSNSTFTFLPKDFGFEKYLLIYIMFFISPVVKRIIIGIPFCT